MCVVCVSVCGVCVIVCDDGVKGVGVGMHAPVRMFKIIYKFCVVMAIHHCMGILYTKRILLIRYPLKRSQALDAH